MKILCTDSEAAMLLDVANHVDPDIARYRGAHRSRKPAVDFYPLDDSLFLSGSFLRTCNDGLILIGVSSAICYSAPRCSFPVWWYSLFGGMGCRACSDLSNVQVICLVLDWRTLRSKHISSASADANERSWLHRQHSTVLDNCSSLNPSDL
jgi:hypothetical protein